MPSAISSFLMFTSFTCEQAALSRAPERAGEGGWGLRPGGRHYLAVPEIVQGDLHVLQLVEAHPALLPRLGGEAGPVSGPRARSQPVLRLRCLPALRTPKASIVRVFPSRAAALP